MKKQSTSKLIAVILALILALSLCACEKGGNGDSGSGSGQGTPAEYTVTFMNGDTKLGEVKVAEGGKASGYEAFESQPDSEFLGWFETPTFLESSKKDLSTLTVTGDMTLYGSFKSTNVAEDTRAWYIVGASTSGGILAGSNWANAGVAEADREAFRLQPTGNAVNEMSITLDLYSGDQFQVVHDWQWDGQKGFGAFTQIDETQMANGGGLGGSSDKSNVNVIMDGNYTVTLTTDPDNPVQDTMTIVRNGDPVSAPQVFAPGPETTVSVKGSWVEDWSDLKELTRAEGDGYVFSIEMELDAGTQLCFMVFDGGVDTGLVLKDENVTDEASRALLGDAGGNIIVADAGTYTFTVDAGTMGVTVAKA